MKKYKNFISTGCSFTAGLTNIINNTLEEWQQQSFRWPHYCFLEMDPENSNFLNFASPGGGNMAAFNNLIYYLELNKDSITCDNTLIGFNITSFERQDTVCYVGHPNSNNYSTRHIHEKLNWAWIHQMFQKTPQDYIKHNENQGATEIRNVNRLAVIQGITYLESRNFDYFFMAMIDSIGTFNPPFFTKFLEERQHNWVKFDGNIGMMEFVKKKGMLDNSQHPTKQGHQLIASYVLDHLNKHEITP